MHGVLARFSVGSQSFSIHGRNLDPGYVTSAAVTMLYTTHRRESMTGTTRVINSLLKGKPRFRQGSNLNEGKLSTLKNNPGSGVGIISFPMGIISFPIVKPS